MFYLTCSILRDRKIIVHFRTYIESRIWSIFNLYPETGNLVPACLCHWPLDTRKLYAVLNAHTFPCPLSFSWVWKMYLWEIYPRKKQWILDIPSFVSFLIPHTWTFGFRNCFYEMEEISWHEKNTFKGSIDRRGERTKIPSRDSYFWLFAFAELVKYRITGDKTFGSWVKLKGIFVSWARDKPSIRKIEIMGSKLKKRKKKKIFVQLIKI